MRSSKSRSRSKTNRPRTLGNIINRVFDSSGPEGKVRGTPQQIIEKYQFLARDAQLSNDRVAAENFMQHAEHYTRMLGEAMREMAAEQEQRQPFQNQGQGGQNAGSGQSGNSSQNGQNNPHGQRDRQNQDRDYRNDRSDFRPDRTDSDASSSPRLDVFEPQAEDDAGLVELPEAPRQQPRREEYRRDDKPREQRNSDRPRDSLGQSDRPQNDRVQNDRPRDDKPREDRSRNDRPRDERPRDDRPRQDRAGTDRAGTDRAGTDRPIEAKTNVETPVEAVVIAAPLAVIDTDLAAPKGDLTAKSQELPKVTRAPRAPRRPASEGKPKVVKSSAAKADETQ